MSAASVPGLETNGTKPRAMSSCLLHSVGALADHWLLGADKSLATAPPADFSTKPCP
ncbi:hypothetical protein [Agrobacterium rosae]|uniref:hypothetical protein n=1 Tax=Agrobacterium rosae TaxID=1972867 RepID=UPI003BA3D806